MAQQNSIKDEDALILKSLEGDEPNLVQVITWIREDQACALEMIQIAEHQRRGIPCDQATLFQEALDLLIKTRMVVIRGSTSIENKNLLGS